MKVVNLEVANTFLKDQNNKTLNMGLTDFSPEPKVPLVIALGCFDGVHVGHRALLNLAVNTAKEKGYMSAALIISASQKNVISSMENRISLIEQLGIDFAIIEDFNSVRGMSKEEYVHRLVNELNCKVAVCGYNFTFGKGRSGSAPDLVSLMQSHNLNAIVLEKVDLNGQTVSSSEIRNHLINGEIEKANLLLGRPYSIEGEIKRGLGLGKHLGFPTINQSLNPDCVHPKNGVYGGETMINGKKYKSITNIGVKPTVTKEKRPSAETHILDFSDDLYGKTVKVNLLYRIRDEKPFGSFEELKAEVQKNIELVKNYPM